ncbi:hypothetical protein Lser_V15G02530 [Lactuca serriola]
MSDLFVVDDTKKRRGGVASIESRNLGFSSFAEPVIDTKEDDEDEEEEEHDDDDDEIKVSDEVFVRNEVDDDEIEEEGYLKTTKKKNRSSSFRYQSCFTDETHDGAYYDDRDGGCSETVDGNSSRQQRWCQSSTVTATVGGDGSFAASTSCSDELDEDGGERSWVQWREE